MFSGKSRPVPSKDALKVLYQLAYISGGTVVGAATLCAEERRRRTQVVQKIADNARRIRQSPRYYQNAAVAHREESEDVVGPESGVQWVQQEESGSRSRRRRRKDTAPIDQTPRAPGLPSVVEKGYAQVEKQNPTRAGAVHQHAQSAQARAFSPSRPITMESRISVATTSSSKSSTNRHGVQKVASQGKVAGSARQRSQQHTANTQDGSEGKPSSIHDLSLPQHETRPKPVARYVRSDSAMSVTRALGAELKLLPTAAQKQFQSILSKNADAFGDGNALESCLGSCHDNGSFVVAGTILRCAKDQLHAARFKALCSSFLTLCESSGSYKLILNVFGPYQPSKICRLQELSDECLEIIAFACVQEGNPSRASSGFFVELYRQLPLHLRSRVAEQWASVPLVALWRSTHDLDRVLKKAHSKRAEATAAEDHNAARLIDTALLDILLSANAHLEALELLGRMHKEVPSDTLAVTVAAVSFAKKGEWSSLEQAVAIAKLSKSFSLNADASRRLNNALHLYTRAHTAAESWKFATSLVNDLGFRPNQATSEIMLQCFIAEGCIWLISKWLRYARIAGFKFTLDARVAGKMLGRFYLQYRPSHIMMLWFTRNIIYGAPALTGRELMDPVKEAIAFDARNVGGQHGRKLRQTLEHDVRRLEGSIGSPDSMDDPILSASPSDDEAAYETTSEDVLDAWAIELPSMIQHDEAEFSTSAAAPEPARTILSASHAAQDDALSDLFGASNDTERDMILALSLRRYDRVVSLYHSSKDGGGLPASPFSLEVAVQACLKLENGSTTSAKQILQEAKANGMNITCAIGPMLVNQMKQMSATSTWKDMGGLRKTVVEYYQISDKNAWPVKHHVGVTAANLLLRAGMPQQAIEVLQTMFESKWARKLVPNIVVMTAALRAYTAVRSDRGIHAIFHTVLKNNLRIDQRFLQVAKRTLRQYRREIGPVIHNQADRAMRWHLIEWIRECHDRRQHQMFEAKITGKKLVACLIKYSKEAEQPTVPLDMRRDIEASIFGATRDYTSPEQVTTRKGLTSKRRERLQAHKVAIAKAVRARHALDRYQPRTTSLRRGGLRWIRQYRAYLRHDLVGPGNKIASFRFREYSGRRRSQVDEATVVASPE